MRAVIFSRPDGAVSITHPAYGDLARPKDDTDEALLERCMARLPPDATGVQVVERDTLPSDRTFRNAWTHDGKTLSVDMAKARAIHMSRIRAARNQALAALDGETIRAVGKGDTASRDSVEARKETLRDMPQTFDLAVARTPEDLAALWPAGLAR